MVPANELFAPLIREPQNNTSNPPLGGYELLGLTP